MKPDFLEMSSALSECPKCGKHSLAQPSHDKYHCLWCGFYRDISSPSGDGWLLIATIIFLVLMVFLANQSSYPTNQLSPPDSSSVPRLEVSPDGRLPLTVQK